MNPLMWIGAVLILGAGWFLFAASSGAKLTIQEISNHARNAGFSGADLITAVAIALAESKGGDPRAYNPETAASGGTPEGKGSYGLWQIYLKVHPEFEGWNLFDPASNAIAAYKVYHTAGDSFRPWSTFKFGQYQAHLSTVQGVISA